MTNKKTEGGDFTEEAPSSLLINWAAIDMIKHKYLATREFVVDEETIQELIDNLIYTIDVLELIREDSYSLTYVNPKETEH